MKNYVKVARKALSDFGFDKVVKSEIYGDGPACGVRFYFGQQTVHDTGARFRGRDSYEMAKRGAHFVQEGTRLAGGGQRGI